MDGDGEIVVLDIVGDLFFFVVDDIMFVIFGEFSFVGEVGDVGIGVGFGDG